MEQVLKSFVPAWVQVVSVVYTRGAMETQDVLGEEALALHREHHGKLSIESSVPLLDRHDLSLAYTPGVARVSSIIGKNAELAREYTIKRNTVAVVSDGSAILGLGNLGPYAALPVMEGKAALFKKFAGVDAFPICLATQDVDAIVETVERIAPAFGGINLEDISAPRCFEVEERLQKALDIPVVHDDQHGTAVVVLAGLLNALRVRGLNKESVRIVVNGAGAAGTAISKLLLEYGFTHLTVCDSKGIIHDDRDDLGPYKKELARRTAPRERGGLADAVRNADLFIGVSKGGLLTEELIRSMRPDPIVFALANPIPEVMPDLAKSAGASIVATGRSDFPNQANNVLAFPGLFRGALDHGVRHITDAMFIAAAEALAQAVPHPDSEHILPSVFDAGVTERVASAIR